MKKTINAHLHLTLEERRIILTGILNNSTKKAIADTIGKDKSTVGKEIKQHRILKHRCPFPLECVAYRKCKLGRNCRESCPDYVPFSCTRRDRSPGACNGCSQYTACRFDKYYYDPELADKEYHKTLIDARLGVNLTVSEAKALSETISPLLSQGLSPYQILQIHPELSICEKTLYNYIEQGVFSYLGGPINLDLRRKVSRKLSKAKGKDLHRKKRNDYRYLQGRTYKDYQQYREDNPDLFVTQMDTVYNDETNGPFVQTFKFLQANLLFAIFHEEKTAAAMVRGINLLEEILGRDVFEKYVSILLTDRGSEFTAADAMETSADNTRRTKVFYCDPMQSGQKGSLENNHILLRYILPKGTDLRELGLTDQLPLNLAISHINSAPVEILGGKTPLQYTAFLYPALYQRLTTFGIHSINPDDVILKPYLLKMK